MATLQGGVENQSGRCSCIKHEKREFTPYLLSHIHTAGQSLCEAGVIVGLSVSEGYTNCWTQPPAGVGGVGFRRCSTVRQALLLELTGELTDPE